MLQASRVSKRTEAWWKRWAPNVNQVSFIVLSGPTNIKKQPSLTWAVHATYGITQTKLALNIYNTITFSSLTITFYNWIFSESLCLNVHIVKPYKCQNILWIIDTGKSDHIINKLHLYANIIMDTSYEVVLPKRNKVNVSHVGVVQILTI